MAPLLEILRQATRHQDGAASAMLLGLQGFLDRLISFSLRRQDKSTRVDYYRVSFRDVRGQLKARVASAADHQLTIELVFGAAQTDEPDAVFHGR